MLVKIHESYRKIAAICDSELLGKKFEQGNMQIEVKKEFYGGEKKTEKEIIKIMKFLAAEDIMFNIIGPKSIDIALKTGIISKEGIIEIQGIPHALVLL